MRSAFLSVHFSDFQREENNCNELTEFLGVFRSSRVGFPVTTTTTSCCIFSSPAQPQHPAGGNGVSRPFTYQSHPSWLSLPVPNEKQPPVTCSPGFSKLGNCNSSQEIREIISQAFEAGILLSVHNSCMAQGGPAHHLSSLPSVAVEEIDNLS